MSKLVKLFAREVLDSRGNFTVRSYLNYQNKQFVATVPSGASTGIYEAVELRDDTPSKAKRAEKATANVNGVISSQVEDVLNKNINTSPRDMDMHMVKTLDGTSNEWGFNKSKLGANAILPVSMNLFQLQASLADKPLYSYIKDQNNTGTKNKFMMPIPSLNIINGGSHAGNKLAFQEFMVMPIKQDNIKDALVASAEVFQVLKGIVKKKQGQMAVNVGDEGGFAPDVDDPYQAVELILEAFEKAGVAGKFGIAMDVAASEFVVTEGGVMKQDLGFKSSPNVITTEKLIDIQLDLAKNQNVISIEDPFDQDDFGAYTEIMKKVPKTCQIVGDDLLVTNMKRIELAMQQKMCDALLLKINQIGTITESIDASNLSTKNGWNVMVSHRSGETEDNFISDLVVGLESKFIKTGAPCRAERTSKYNRLLEIEAELKEGGKDVTYWGSLHKL